MPNENEEITLACLDCGIDINEDDSCVIDGETYCLACVYTCDSCSDVFLLDSSDSVCINDFVYCCERCAESAGFYQCTDCSTWGNDLTYINDLGDVCNSCQHNYSFCDECQNYVSSMVDYCEQSDMYICEDCGDNRPEDIIIHDYSYKPVPLMAKLAWENTIYLGIELEVECLEADKHEKAKKLMAWLKGQKSITGRELSNYLYFKNDGSLNNGFEIVFHPITLQAIHKEFPFDKFLKKLKNLKLYGYKSGRCGLHIHISKSGLILKDGGVGDARHVGKAFLFVCSRQLKLFSRRKDFYYTKFDSCFPVDGLRQENGRYSAFNTAASSATVELRFFRSTIKYNRFMSSLQFADSFGDYINNRSIAFMKNNTSNNVWHDFLGHCRQAGKYETLLKYFKNNNVK